MLCLLCVVEVVVPCVYLGGFETSVLTTGLNVEWLIFSTASVEPARERRRKWSPNQVGVVDPLRAPLGDEPPAMWHRIGDARCDVTPRPRVGRVHRDVPRALAILVTTSRAVQTFAVKCFRGTDAWCGGGNTIRPENLISCCPPAAVSPFGYAPPYFSSTLTSRVLERQPVECPNLRNSPFFFL